MYFVKREVIATTLDKAIKGRGEIYEVVVADEKYWPEIKEKLGYNKKI